MTSRNLRHAIFERDSHTCVLCNAAPTDVHHVTPRSQGGRDHEHNLVSLCRMHHDLLHGQRWIGCELDKKEAEQTIAEYIFDYYFDSIELGLFEWPV